MRVGGRIFVLALLSSTSIFSNTHVNAAVFAYPSIWMGQPKSLTTLERVEPEKNLPLTHPLDVQKQKGFLLAPFIFFMPNSNLFFLAEKSRRQRLETIELILLMKLVRLRQQDPLFAQIWDTFEQIETYDKNKRI